MRHLQSRVCRGVIAASILLAPALPACAQTPPPACLARSNLTAALQATHSGAPYPLKAHRLGEEGTVVMVAHIGPDGVPTRVEVQTSSGFSDLDEAARAWVQQTWRWPADSGTCPLVHEQVTYRWHLTHPDDPQ
jgi:protein TonB